MGIKITNENFHIIGVKIQDIIDTTFGKSDKGFIKFNMSKSKRNKYGVEQILMLSLPTVHCSLSYTAKDIYYTGGFYKGYYRLRGAEIYNFRVNIKEVSDGWGNKVPLEVDVLDALSDELYKMKLFIVKMNQLFNEIEPLNTADSIYETLADTNNFIYTPFYFIEL